MKANAKESSQRPQRTPQEFHSAVFKENLTRVIYQNMIFLMYFKHMKRKSRLIQLSRECSLSVITMFMRITSFYERKVFFNEGMRLPFYNTFREIFKNMY